MPPKADKLTDAEKKKIKQENKAIAAVLASRCHAMVIKCPLCSKKVKEEIKKALIEAETRESGKGAEKGKDGKGDEKGEPAPKKRSPPRKQAAATKKRLRKRSPSKKHRVKKESPVPGPGRKRSPPRKRSLSRRRSRSGKRRRQVDSPEYGRGGQTGALPQMSPDIVRQDGPPIIPVLHSVMMGTVRSVFAKGGLVELSDGSPVRYFDGLLRRRPGMKDARVGDKLFVEVVRVEAGLAMVDTRTVNTRTVNQKTGQDEDPQNDQAEMWLDIPNTLVGR